MTGSDGFIGSNLLRHLINKGYLVHCIDIQSGNDINTCDLPTEIDLVIHLAGIGGVRESVKDPAKYWRVNVDGTRRIVDNYPNARVLVAGSSSGYEPHLNPYAASKKVIESIKHDNICFMRFHTVYGPQPRMNMFFDKLLSGSLQYVTNHTRDFIHICDLISAIDILIQHEYKGPIDVGTGQSVRISDIRPDLPIVTETPGERSDTLADITIMKVLGFEPKYTVKKFLDEQNIEHGLEDECIRRTRDLQNVHRNTQSLQTG